MSAEDFLFKSKSYWTVTGIIKFRIENPLQSYCIMIGLTCSAFVSFFIALFGRSPDFPSQIVGFTGT